MTEENKIDKNILKEVVKEKSLEDLNAETYYNIVEQKNLNKFLKDHKTEGKRIFLIKNRKTNRIVEIKADTVLLAASAVGWRLRHVEVLKAVDNVIGG